MLFVKTFLFNLMSFVSTFDHTNLMTDTKQLDQLKSDYAMMIVDGMDMDSLVTIAVESIEENLKDWDLDDVKEDIVEHYGMETWIDLAGE